MIYYCLHKKEGDDFIFTRATALHIFTRPCNPIRLGKRAARHVHIHLYTYVNIFGYTYICMKQQQKKTLRVTVSNSIK